MLQKGFQNNCRQQLALQFSDHRPISVFPPNEEFFLVGTQNYRSMAMKNNQLSHHFLLISHSKSSELNKVAIIWIKLFCNYSTSQMTSAGFSHEVHNVASKTFLQQNLLMVPLPKFVHGSSFKVRIRVLCVSAPGAHASVIAKFFLSKIGKMFTSILRRSYSRLYGLSMWFLYQNNFHLLSTFPICTLK